MAFPITQILAASFKGIVNVSRKAENQWAESSLMAEFERQGFIVKKSFGSTLEATLDVRRNPGTVIQASDLVPLSMQKTEVLSAASYDIAEVTAPIVWSKKDEVMNPSENQVVDLVKGLVNNALDSHDDILEQSMFLTSTNGFLGFLTHIPDNGQGTDGGIDSGVETVWRSQQATYVDDTDIESCFTSVWNACAKGSGSKLMPTLMVSDGPTQAIFEGTQQAFQRYADQELTAGFKTLMFKTARYIFSQYGGTRVYFSNPRSLQLQVSKEYFRDLGEAQELENANGFGKKVYTACQLLTNNKSRLGVAHL